MTIVKALLVILNHMELKMFQVILKPQLKLKNFLVKPRNHQSQVKLKKFQANLKRHQSKVKLKYFLVKPRNHQSKVKLKYFQVNLKNHQWMLLARIPHMQQKEKLGMMLSHSAKKCIMVLP